MSATILPYAIIIILCTSDIVAIPFWPLHVYPIGHYIRPQYKRTNVFCTRKSGHFIQMATINVATISGVHCTDQGPKGRSQYNGQGVYCGLSTASEVILIFTTQLYQYLSVFFYLHYLVMSLKYSFLNTPKQQYFMLHTSGGW